MEELDVLKKAWKKEESSYNQVTEKDIYGMLSAIILFCKMDFDYQHY